MTTDNYSNNNDDAFMWVIVNDSKILQVIHL